MVQFHEALGKAGIHAWVRDLRAGTLVLAADFWRELGYCPMDRTTANEWRDFLHPDDLVLHHTRIDEYVEGHAAEFQSIFRFRNANGGWVRLQSIGRSVEPNAAERMVLVGTIRQVPEDSVESVVARDDHVRLAVAQERAGVGTWEVDIGTRAITLDPVSLRLHGLPEDMPMPISEEMWASTVDNDVENGLREYERAVRTHDQYNFEYSTGGGEKWILGIGRVVFDDGRPVKLVGINLDITERQKSQRLVDRMRGELLQLARVNAMGSMAATMAHELNQPLAATANYLSAAEIMLAQEDVEGVKRAVVDAAAAALKAGDIIRRIRDGMTGRSFVRRSVELDAVLKSAIAVMTLKDETPTIQLKCQSSEPITVLIDPVQIEQVLVNLIRNALEAMKGVEKPRIQVKAFTAGTNAVIQIKDAGCGISDQLAQNIFDTFATSKPDGMGLGLAICRTIVEAHEGRIRLEETSEAGTTFSVELPLAKGTETT